MERFEWIGEGPSSRATVQGDGEEGTLHCGQLRGSNRELNSAREIVEDITAEAASAIARLQPGAR